MRTYRTEMVYAVLVSLILVGAVVFVMYRMGRESKMERADLYDLILPDARCVISVNQPTRFMAMLERQPELNAYFREIIPADLVGLLDHVKHAPVLLVCYPQTVVACYPINDRRDRLTRYLDSRTSLKMKEEGVTFDFYPRDSRSYLGSYEYEGICVAGNSRKQLLSIAKVHERKSDGQSPVSKDCEALLDKSALVNSLYHIDATNEWQTFDVFMHDEQVCCFLNRPYRHEPDSLIQAMADSLSVCIRALVSGIEVHTGYSKDDSAVYYTFCAPLLPKP